MIMIPLYSRSESVAPPPPPFGFLLRDQSGKCYLSDAHRAERCGDFCLVEITGTQVPFSANLMKLKVPVWRSDHVMWANLFFFKPDASTAALLILVLQ